MDGLTLPFARPFPWCSASSLHLDYQHTTALREYSRRLLDSPQRFPCHNKKKTTECLVGCFLTVLQQCEAKTYVVTPLAFEDAFMAVDATSVLPPADACFLLTCFLHIKKRIRRRSAPPPAQLPIIIKIVISADLIL